MGLISIAHLDPTEIIILKVVRKASGVELKELERELQTWEPTKKRSEHSSNVKEELAIYIRSCGPC
jgi:hypothetical protein